MKEINFKGVAQKAPAIHSVIFRPQADDPCLKKWHKVNWILSQFQPSQVKQFIIVHLIKLVSLLQRIL